MRRMYSKNELDNEIKDVKKDISTLVDKDSHDRFVEGNGTPADNITGLTSVYCKWSLSGTHLMCVFAGTIAQGNAIASGSALASFTLPNWIVDKIYGVQASLIEYKAIDVVSEAYNVEQLKIYINKLSNGLVIATNNTFASTYGGGFRIAIDLMIDSE